MSKGSAESADKNLKHRKDPTELILAAHLGRDSIAEKAVGDKQRMDG